MAAVLEFPITRRRAITNPLSELHSQYCRPLNRYFRKYRLNPADAEDLAQEVFVRLASLKSCVMLRRPEAFIFTLARNLVRDRARRLHIRAGARSVGLDHLDLCCAGPTPEERLELEQELARAERILAALKPGARTAFVMHRVDGESYAAIASRMNVSVSMVEKHIMSATAQLRTKL
ncbi:MAG TPA: sigma-70 family RNA polymerase sigma factor [Xanthobacteraceae bacterium]|jgi:RNA polymerase sigma-70 factor (ECF subfamily)